MAGAGADMPGLPWKPPEGADIPGLPDIPRSADMEGMAEGGLPRWMAPAVMSVLAGRYELAMPGRPFRIPPGRSAAPVM